MHRQLNFSPPWPNLAIRSSMPVAEAGFLPFVEPPEHFSRLFWDRCFRGPYRDRAGYNAEIGLPADRLSVQRIEDTDGKCDHIVCLNVLSNIDNYHRPLERLLLMARKSVVLRESLKDGAAYQYVRDNFLDAGVDLKVHVNHYDIEEITTFIGDYGFKVERVIDRRTGGNPEAVIGHEHYWTFIVATRRI